MSIYLKQAPAEWDENTTEEEWDEDSCVRHYHLSSSRLALLLDLAADRGFVARPALRPPWHPERRWTIGFWEDGSGALVSAAQAHEFADALRRALDRWPLLNYDLATQVDLLAAPRVLDELHQLGLQLSPEGEWLRIDLQRFVAFIDAGPFLVC